MDTIPVANIYFLLCYAWDQFAPDALNRIADEQGADILELFSRLLATGVRTLHRRGFETGYIEREEFTSTIRGRILIGSSIKSRANVAHRLVCSHHELTSNVLRNQILKSTLLRILEYPVIDSALRREIGDALAFLRTFDAIRLTDRVFYEVQSRNGNRLYGFLINICLFLFESLQPTESIGALQLVSVLSWTLSLKRHSKVPPLGAGRRGVELLFGLAFSGTV